MFIHEDFVSLTRTVEDEEHRTTSTLQVAFFSATLGCKATLSLTSRASSRAHTRFGSHASSRWWSPPVAFPHHSTSHDASRTSRAPIIAPHVPTIISSTTGLSFTYRPCLLFLHIQTYLTSEHDGLQKETQVHCTEIKFKINFPIYFTTHIIHWFANKCIRLKPLQNMRALI